MNTENVRHLLKQGMTPRQIAKEYGYNRKDVEKVAAEMSSSSHSLNIKRIVIPLLVLVVGGIISLVGYSMIREPADMEVYQNIVRVSDALSTDRSGGSWFIEQESKPETIYELATEIPLIERLTSKLEKALSDNTDVLLVKEERGMFSGHFMPTIFTSSQGGATRMVGTDDKIFKDPKHQEVIFYGHFALDHPRIKHRLLFYDSAWRAVIVGALNFTDEKWYNAILTHELWHAKMHRENNPTSIAPALSQPWIMEELQAHDIELAVLNARTGGNYMRKLREIIDRRPARSLKRFLAKLKPDDFRNLDSLFKPGIPEEVDIRAAQYALNLSHAWLKGRYKGEELQQKRMEAYSYLIDPSKSTNVQ